MAIQLLIGASIMESGCEVGVNQKTNFPCGNPVRVWAVWDSNQGCVTTPSSTFVWYYWNGSSWVEMTRFTPGIYQGYVYQWVDINNGCDRRFKVTFAGMSSEFTIGTDSSALQVTSIKAAPSNNPSYPASAGWVKVDVSATGQGTFRILVDGVEVERQGPVNASTGSSWGFNIQMRPGTHNVCAEAV